MTHPAPLPARPETTAFAHTYGPDPSDWEPLRDHLQAVAAHAEDFGAAFGAAGSVPYP